MFNAENCYYFDLTENFQGKKVLFYSSSTSSPNSFLHLPPNNRLLDSRYSVPSTPSRSQWTPPRGHRVSSFSFLSPSLRSSPPIHPFLSPLSFSLARSISRDEHRTETRPGLELTHSRIVLSIVSPSFFLLLLHRVGRYRGPRYVNPPLWTRRAILCRGGCRVTLIRQFLRANTTSPRLTWQLNGVNFTGWLNCRGYIYVD